MSRGKESLVVDPLSGSRRHRHGGGRHDVVLGVLSVMLLVCIIEVLLLVVVVILGSRLSYPLRSRSALHVSSSSNGRH